MGDDICPIHLVVEHLEPKPEICLRFRRQRLSLLLDLRRGAHSHRPSPPRSLPPAPVPDQDPFAPPTFPGVITPTGLSATPPGPDLMGDRFAGYASRPPNTASRVASPSPMHASRRHAPDRIARCTCRSPSPAAAAFPESQPGRLLHHPFRGRLSVHCALPPACSPSPCTGPSTPKASAASSPATVPMATNWGDRLGRPAGNLTHRENAPCHGAPRNAG